MPYFKNTELARLYRVSDKTIYNWISEAKSGRLDLALHELNGKTYVANTARNVVTIEELVAKRKKYRNSRGRKEIVPAPKFYTIYSETQIYDIVSNLDAYREVPREYNYFDGGASNWDKYTQRLATESTSNLLNSTMKLLDISSGYLDHIFQEYDQINIIDIGVGNGRPVKELVARLLKQERLGRYIALDISREMLNIAERNFREWFGGRVAFEGYEMDINYERFRKILASEYIKKGAERTLNIALLLGGTNCNLRDPDGMYKAIRDSLGVKDLLLHTQKLDTESSRRYFDFNLSEKQTASLAPNHRFIFDLLNIDDSLYDVEMGYDTERNQRYIRVRLKMALTIRFDFERGVRLVDFEKGETILLWRYWQMSAQDAMAQLERNGFYVMYTSQTNDHEYLLAVSQVKGEHSL